MKEHPLRVIHQRTKLNEKLKKLYDLTCHECQKNPEWQRAWGEILEQVLYKKRKDDKR